MGRRDDILQEVNGADKSRRLACQARQNGSTRAEPERRQHSIPAMLKLIWDASPGMAETVSIQRNQLARKKRMPFGFNRAVAPLTRGIHDASALLPFPTDAAFAVKSGVARH